VLILQIISPGIIKQTTESTNKTENVSANQNDDLDITIETVTTKVSKSHDEDLDITMKTATTKVSTGHDEDLDITMKTATTKVSKSNIISLTTEHEKETFRNQRLS
jgi:predicted NAD/FAD-dependent oxidoreductase